MGDLASDSPNVGEIIGFVRSSNPLQSDYDVHRATLTLLTSWIERGWLRVVPQPAYGLPMRTIEELMPYLEHHSIDVAAPDSSIPLPEIDLTDQAFADVEWLRGAVERGVEAGGDTKQFG